MDTAYTPPLNLEERFAAENELSELQNDLRKFILRNTGEHVHVAQFPKLNKKHWEPLVTNRCPFCQCPLKISAYSLKYSEGSYLPKFSIYVLHKDFTNPSNKSILKKDSVVIFWTNSEEVAEDPSITFGFSCAGGGCDTSSMERFSSPLALLSALSYLSFVSEEESVDEGGIMGFTRYIGIMLDTKKFENSSAENQVVHNLQSLPHTVIPNHKFFEKFEQFIKHERFAHILTKYDIRAMHVKMQEDAEKRILAVKHDTEETLRVVYDRLVRMNLESLALGLPNIDITSLIKYLDKHV